MDKNEEIVFKQKLKNLKIFQIFVLVIAICAVVLATFTSSSLVEKIKENENDIQILEERLDKMQLYLGYEEDEDGTSQLDSSETDFLETEYVKSNTLEPNITKENLFKLNEKTYYVMFYMDNCQYCIDVENKMQSYLDRDDAAPVYFYNAGNISENTDIQWDTSDEPNYSPTVENFSLIGTPTLLKVENGKAKAFVGTDEIIEELELQ